MGDQNKPELEHSSSRVESSRPSRELRLSHYDSRGLTAVWKDEDEQIRAEGVLSSISAAFHSIIHNLGDPQPDREGLSKTPQRAAKALLYFTKGYEEDLNSE